MEKQQNLFTPEEFKKNFVKNPKAKKEKKEEKIQLLVCDYLRANYPDVIWFCDLSSGLKLPIWIAALNARMRSSRGLPDLYIAKPKVDNKGLAFCGLFIELKRDEVRLKNGNLASSDHIKEQMAIGEKLRQMGYKFEFACGYTEAINIITEYLG
jgi:hypothetical protein